MRAGFVHLQEVPLLRRAQFGLSAAEVTFRPSDLHPLSHSGPDQIRFELGHHRKDVEQKPPHGIVRIVDKTADVELDVLGGEFVDDVLRIAKPSREPIQLRNHKRVSVSAGRERFPQTGSCAIRAGQAMVSVDVEREDSKPFRRDALSGQVLFMS